MPKHILDSVECVDLHAQAEETMAWNTVTKRDRKLSRKSERSRVGSFVRQAF